MHDEHPRWLYVCFPAVAMLLGWGLRGYIGGGPFGAMIPGAFVALCISLLLGHRAEVAAVVALFGAIGIGYGGDMTYGQTLGLAQGEGAMVWGMLGVTVKGAVWGLLGGAVLGIGLTRDVYTRRQLLAGLLLSLLGFYLGWKLINEPRLIYFSDPVNKPREESWAGLLAAALALLAWERHARPQGAPGVPARFALLGMLGGGLGFGLGTLWLVFGPKNVYIGWWKMMEFSFGLIFGGFLGYAAWTQREHLVSGAAPLSPVRDPWWPVAALFALIAGFFLAPQFLSEAFPATGTVRALVLGDLLRVVFSFIFFGAVCIALGINSTGAAWHIALTITFFHTVFDLSGDLVEHNGFTLGAAAQVLVIALATGGFAFLVERLRKGSAPVQSLFLLVMWACYGTACFKSFFHREYLFPEPGAPGFVGALMDKEPGILFVHGTFTISLLITTYFIVRRFSLAPDSK
ncbi:MAG: hypothetical protein HYV27_05510 [Candidatus Hydrogenedentes bacterium]|nr:hypothetical protein [Candidatus Hydrogenedentota bacterium]